MLSNTGRGSDGPVLRGINWAIEAGAQIISMSLGRFVLHGATHSSVYERAARRALDRNVLIVAAAGNDSKRPRTIEPVNSPANTPSVMAVAAVDQASQVASFSNAGINQDDGQIDIAGPGVTVRSAWPGGTYKSISGTSTAAPSVAGVAAVLAGSDSSLRGAAFWHALMIRSRRLVLPSRDVGSGMVFFG